MPDSSFTLGKVGLPKSDPELLERFRTPGPPLTAEQQHDSRVSWIVGQSGYDEALVRQHLAEKGAN